MKRYLLSALAGAVLPLAFAPFGQFWLAPLSYAALFYFWSGTRPWEAFRVCFAFGFTSFFFGTYWTYTAVREFGGAPIVLAVALTVGLTAVLALFVAAAGYVAARWFPKHGVAAWLGTFPAMFVLGEWLRGWCFSGFGWLSAGYSQTSSWLMGYAPVTGLHGMSWAVLFTAGAVLTFALGTAAQRTRAALALALVWAFGFVAHGYGWTAPKDKAITVALIQGSVTQDLKWRPEQLPGTLDLYAQLTQENAGTDLIVWPEAAIPTLYEYVQDYLSGVQAVAARSGSTVLLGILRTEPGGGPTAFQNVLVALTQPTQIYVKRHLVPFGEYFPVPSFIRSWMRLMSLPFTDATPGTHDQPLIKVGDERVAVTICYESVFGAEQLGFLPEATLLVNVSNDAWFGNSVMPHQHLQVDQVRAAEAGRYLLKATNTGMTAVVDAQGRVAKTVPQFETKVLKYAVQGYTGTTPYAFWGNWLVVASAVAVLAALLPALRKLVRRPRA